MKSFLKKLINKLGYNVTKIRNNLVNIDEIIKNKIPSNPIIFDVGGNIGQSIQKFTDIFKNPTIHSFEPSVKDYEFMNKHYGLKKNIYLNNYALGEKIENKKFNLTLETATSSFNKINKNTEWLKHLTKKHNINNNEYIISDNEVKINTLDNYFKKYEITKIDLLKIDTQGYEDKVLEGSLNSIKNNKIGAILTEIMFDDVYDKYFSFSEIEKYLTKENYRMVAIELSNNNLFSGLTFAAGVLYLNRKHHEI